MTRVLASPFATPARLELLAAAVQQGRGGGGNASVPTMFTRTPAHQGGFAWGGGGGNHDLGLRGPRDDSFRASKAELHGEPDGDPIQLPQGIVVQKRRIGDTRVSTGELMDAVRGIYGLPERDMRLVASQGVHVHLLPSRGLEDNLLGATTIVQDRPGSPWRPTLVRVATRAGGSGTESTPEIVQHELGHVVAVLTRQDRSEAAAETYAARFR